MKYTILVVLFVIAAVLGCSSAGSSGVGNNSSAGHSPDSVTGVSNSDHASIVNFTPVVRYPPFQFPLTFNADHATVSDTVQAGTTKTLTATCPTGSKMIGGGHALQDNPSCCPYNFDFQSPQIVLASYPSSADSWTVKVKNPMHKDQTASAEAYCAGVANPLAYSSNGFPDYYYPFQLHTTIVQSPTVQLDSATLTSIEADCPVGTVATAGGYTTTYTDEFQGLYDAWMWHFGPVIDSTGTKATGWKVVGTVIFSRSIALTKVYAICASQYLQPATVKVVNIYKEAPPYQYWQQSGQAVCDPNQFTVGGGHEFGPPTVGLQLTHVLLRTTAADDGGNANQDWSLTGIYGHKLDQTVNMLAYAVCLRIPSIDVTIKITSPQDGQEYPVDPNNQITDPITFQASAFDRFGNPLRGTAIQWTTNGGKVLGSRESMVARLTPGDYLPQTITATATDTNGHIATDVISVDVGPFPR